MATVEVFGQGQANIVPTRNHAQATAYIIKWKYTAGATSTLSSAAINGNLLIGIYIDDGTSALTIPSDWTLLQDGYVRSGTYGWHGLAYKWAIGGETSFTVTGALATVIIELAGVVLRLPDTSASRSSTSTLHPYSQITPTSSIKAFILGTSSTNDYTVALTPDSGYKQLHQSDNGSIGFDVIYKIESSTSGTYTVGSTYTGTARYERSLSAAFELGTSSKIGLSNAMAYISCHRYANSRAFVLRDNYQTLITGDSPTQYLALDEGFGTAAMAVVGPDATYPSSGVTYDQSGVYNKSPLFTASTGITTTYTKIANTFTMEAWVKTSATISILPEAASGNYTGTAGANYVFYANVEGGSRGAGISVGTNGIQVMIHGTGAWCAPLVYEASIGTGWNHIAVTYTLSGSNRTPKLYLNGRYIKTGLSNTQTMYSPLIWAGGPAYGDFDGQVDEMAVYASELSAEQIYEHANFGMVFGQAFADIKAPYRFAQANVFIVTNDYMRRILLDSPIAYYRLGESSGDTFANVINPSEPLTRTTGTIYHGQTHTILDDTNTAILISSAKLTGTVNAVNNSTGVATTVEFWMYWNGVNTGQMPFSFNVDYSDLYIYTTTDFGFNTGSGDVFGFDPTAAGMAGKWSHIVAVFYHNQPIPDANKIYLNGVAQSLSQLRGGANTGKTAKGIVLSGWSGSGQYFTNGKLDEVSLYNGELSANTIAEHYQASVSKGFGQAQAYLGTFWVEGAAQAQIVKNTFFGIGNSLGLIKVFDFNVFAQSQTTLNQSQYVAQALTKIYKPIEITHLTNFTGSGTSISSTTINPASDSLILVSIYTQANALPTSVTGCGLTFELITSQGFWTGASPSRLLHIWRARGTATSGTITITYSQSRNVEAHVTEIKNSYNVDDSNGSSAIVQYNGNYTDSSTGVRVTLNYFRDALRDASFGFHGGTQGPLLVDTDGVSYTQLAETTTYDNIQTQYLLGEDLSVYAGKGAAPSGLYGGIALEIRSSWVPETFQVFGQAFTNIYKEADRKYPTANVLALINQSRNYLNANALAYMTATNIQVFAQAAVFLSYGQFGQARAKIIYSGILKAANAQVFIAWERGYGQALAHIIKLNIRGFARAQALINRHWGFGQAQLEIWGAPAGIRVSQVGAEVIVKADAKIRASQVGAETLIRRIPAPYIRASRVSAEAIYTDTSTIRVTQTNIEVLVYETILTKLGQSLTWINKQKGIAHAQARIVSFDVSKFAQARCTCYSLYIPVEPGEYMDFGCAIADIWGYFTRFANALADIQQTYQQNAQADSWMCSETYCIWVKVGAAQALIVRPEMRHAHSQTIILGFTNIQADMIDLGGVLLNRTINFTQPLSMFTWSYSDPLLVNGNTYEQENAPTGWAKINLPDVYNLYINATASSSHPVTVWRGTPSGPVTASEYGFDTFFEIYNPSYQPIYHLDDGGVFGTATEQRTVNPVTIGPGIYYIIFSTNNEPPYYTYKEIIDTPSGTIIHYDYNNDYPLWLNVTMLLGPPAAFSQAQVLVTSRIKQARGQALVTIINTLPTGQSVSFIEDRKKLAASAAYISKSVGFGQAQSYMKTTGVKRYAIAQGTIDATSKKFANSHCKILTTYQNVGQSQTIVRRRRIVNRAQAIALIVRKNMRTTGQAAALIGHFGFANSQGTIFRTYRRYGQARTFVDAGNYLVVYNNQRLPGYAQSESLESVNKIKFEPGPYQDTTLAEYQGLENKAIVLRMKALEDNYPSVKEAVQEAYTILRSNRTGFARLYIQHRNKHYLAMVKSITSSKEASESNAALDYEVNFITKPWLISNTSRSISRFTSGTLDTINRTLANGGWTPTVIKISGTDVTVSGYTEYGQFAGFISVSGEVTNLTIDTENYTVTMGGESRFDVIKNYDFETYIGPGVTYFEVTGITSCQITWHDRWYL